LAKERRTMRVEKSLEPWRARAVASTVSYSPREPGGAVLVLKDGELVLRAGYGMANLELAVEIEPDTVFEIGSMTKQFTASCVLLLAERGRLRLSDEIGHYLPDYPAQGHKITLQHLLTHTSGLPNYTDLAEWEARESEDLEPDEVMAFFKDKPLEFAPGERWLYSSSGYILLGHVIERVSGRSYERFVTDEIFTALGMTSTRVGSMHDVIGRRASGYQKDGHRYVNARYASLTQAYSSASLVSTVDDLGRWDRALDGEVLLKRASLDRMFTPARLSSGRSTRYACGWWIAQLGGRQVIAHGGGTNGFASVLLRIPQEHLVVVILSNNPAHDPSPCLMAVRIAARLLGLPEHPVVTLPSATLDEYAGVYVDDQENVTRIVTCAGGRLSTQRAGGDRSHLQASACDLFYYPDGFSTLRFIRDGKGQVTEAVIDRILGPEVPLRKTAQSLPAEGQASSAYNDACVGV
jgi:D-alanyl-D-alanine carboxypeptidase